jgi:hypothetical protein
MRKLGAIAVAAGLAALVAGCTPTPPGGAPGPAAAAGLRLQPSKASYRLGEAVEIAVIVGNTGSTPCKVGGVTPGSITVRSLTRDGTPEIPGITVAEYVDGFASFLSANVTSIAAGRSVTLDWRSDATADGKNPALSTYTLETGDEAAVARWPVDRPGRFQLSAAYLWPPFPGSPSGLCPISAEPVSASFEITP